MGSLGLRIAGGILGGVGKTITDQANARFEAALKQVEMEQNDQYKARDEERQHGYRMKEGEIGFGQKKEILGLQHTNALAENAQSIGARRGLLSSTTVGDDGKVYGITQGGDAKDLGITSGKARGLSDGDNRLLQRVEAANTTKDDINGTKVDKQGVASDLVNAGRKDLAAIYDPSVASTTPGAGTSGAQQYNSAEDVRKAYQSGKLTKPEAETILKKKFNYQ